MSFENDVVSLSCSSNYFKLECFMGKDYSNTQGKELLKYTYLSGITTITQLNNVECKDPILSKYIH